MSIASPSVVDDLLALVRSAGYRPGDRLPPIRELSRVLRSNRNAVRDGLLEAQTLGLVKIEPRQGVFVQEAAGGRASGGASKMLESVLKQDDLNLFHLVDARRVVETELAGEAARTRRPEDLLPLRQSLEKVLGAGDDRATYIEADEAFHSAIGAIAGNRVLSAFLEVLWRLIRPAKSHLLLSSQNRRLSDREHQELFQSIVDGDEARARTTMDGHIRQGRALLLDYARSVPAIAGTSVAKQHDHDRTIEPKRKKIGGKKS